MRGGAGALTSRIGRRFVLLFVGCALVPLAVFTALSVGSVTRQARADMHARLHGSAKSAGMSLAARLNQVKGDIALVASLVQNSGGNVARAMDAALRQHLAERCRSVQLITETERTLIYGDDIAVDRTISEADHEHLAAGLPLARMRGTPRHLEMAIAIQPADPNHRVVAVVRGSWLFHPDELRGVSCEFAAFDGRGELLFDTFQSPPPSGPLRAALHRDRSSGVIEWSIGGEDHVARYWRAFMQPQYRLDLLAVQSQRSSDAMAVASSFVQWFWLCAFCTLLCVVLASLVQMRRTLGPIVSLHEAADRLGNGDLSVRVAVATADELGDLGDAFNVMVDRLEENTRRRELTEIDLVASRDAALAAMRAKATFLTNVSHELRTPMAEILSATEILTTLGDEDNDAREEFSGIALHGARRLAGLVDDVLAIDDVSADFDDPVDVRIAVRLAVERITRDDTDRIALAVAEDLPRARGDRDRLVEAFGRLLDNAFKFSPAGSPIAVRVRTDDGAVVVEVEDRGPGIAVEDLDQIFEPFCQVGRDQMTEKADGVGLGLTIAKRIVDACGGTISVSSSVGQGATFRVALQPATVAV